MIGEHRITTFGLSNEQNNIIMQAFPQKDYELYNTEVFSDMIALYAVVAIVNTEALTCDDYDLFVCYLSEVGDFTDTTTIWIGPTKPPKSLKSLKHFINFDDFRDNIKYILLNAHKKTHKTADYSKRLSEAIMVLSLIRKTPGITTKRISEKTDIKVRNVQRYIATLQAAGEWIEYDYKCKGWKLTNGISILFGNL